MNGRSGTRLNIADRLRVMAERQPEARAVVVPWRRDGAGRRSYIHQTFRALDRMSDVYARGLSKLGVTQGMHCLLMVRPSLEFFGLSFALFRLGAVPVLLDPAMGKANILGAIAEVEPGALIGIPKAHWARRLYRQAFRSVRVKVAVGPKWFWGACTLERVVREGGDGAFRGPDTRPEDPAAILFTSGSTGPPKGVIYTHQIFDEQVNIFERQLGIEPGEVDLSAFPLFSLFSVALGATAVVPDMDPTRAANVDPKNILEAFDELGVTYAFGSPAFWKPVAAYAEARGLRFRSLTRILMAGAPAPVPLLRQLLALVPNHADVYTPYGATEALPVTLPSVRGLLDGLSAKTEAGAGVCVGLPISGTELRVIPIADGPVTLDEARPVLPREMGEIMVKSPVTTAAYHRRPQDNQRSKVKDGSGFWHRMGDVGYLDDEGRLWFCGRKNHRVQSAHGPMYTVCCEAIFNRHPWVYRTALVGVGPAGQARPVIVVECHPNARPRGFKDRRQLEKDLLSLASEFEETRLIKDVLFCRALPVDARHNAKIRREEVAVWAARKLRLHTQPQDTTVLRMAEGRKP